ncbi:MAG: LLM class flavin-dependent oxidoreductase, partial [Gemmatimonadaceae bacterium]
MPMKLVGPDGAVDVFTVSPRTLDTDAYWRNIEDVTRWSERYGCTGVLLFTGNDTYVEPWLVAQHVCATSTLSPLVAVNPIYMHPFTTAKMIASLSYLYRRRICLNVVAGTALSHQEALDDRLGHDARYERLSEHVQIVLQLLRGQGLTSFEGTHYRVRGARLPIPLPPALYPDVF